MPVLRSQVRPMNVGLVHYLIRRRQSRYAEMMYQQRRCPMIVVCVKCGEVIGTTEPKDSTHTIHVVCADCHGGR